MSISRQNLTVVIVTLKSDHVIDQCIQSIDGNISILVVENSQNQDFKNNIEKKYKNVSCILTNKNIGMGSGNNFGILNTKTDFVMILNPDVLFKILPLNTVELSLLHEKNKSKIKSILKYIQLN